MELLHPFNIILTNQINFIGLYLIKIPLLSRFWNFEHFNQSILHLVILNPIFILNVWFQYIHKFILFRWYLMFIHHLISNLSMIYHFDYSKFHYWVWFECFQHYLLIRFKGMKHHHWLSFDDILVFQECLNW